MGWSEVEGREKWGIWGMFKMGLGGVWGDFEDKN